MFGFMTHKSPRNQPSVLLSAALWIRHWDPYAKPLKVQRLLYISQVVHLGRYSAPIFDDQFHATMFGPIIPELMPKLKSRLDLFEQDPRHLDNLTFKTKALLQDIVIHFGKFSDAQLVAITHRNGGAWAKNYDPYFPSPNKDCYRGRLIPNDDLATDYPNYVVQG